MTRSLPASVLFHVGALLMVFLFGTFVDRPQLELPRTIQVQMVPAPQVEAETPPPRDEEPPAPEEVPEPVVPDPVEPEPVPVPVAEQPVPEPEPEPEVRPEEPEPVAPAPEAEQPPAETEAAPQVTSVTGTDQEIPAQFQYYITLLQGRVARNWNPKRLGFREGSRRSCVVHFTVERDGRVTRETIERPSGVSLFDQEALGAVRRVGRMPPLPSGIRGQNLGVHFTFTLETGS